MNTIQFEIPGEVVPQGRPRATNRAGYIHLYQPNKCSSFQQLVKLSAQRVMGNSNPFQGPIALSMTFYVSIPKSFPKKS